MDEKPREEVPERSFSIQKFCKGRASPCQTLEDCFHCGKIFQYTVKNLSGMYLLQMRGSDDMEDHCITVSDKWIVDSHFKKVLSRTKESLNMCCSTDEVPCQFVTCVNVEHFPKSTFP